MGRWSRFAIGCGLVLALALPGWNADATDARDAETAVVLGQAIEALDSDDPAGFAEAADELRAGGHWLPAVGWEALDDGDADLLVRIRSLLEGEDVDVLELAYESVLEEHTRLRDLIELGDPAADAATGGSESTELIRLLDAADDRGAAALAVIDRRGIDVSPEARAVLGPLDADPPATLPRPSRYGPVLVAMAGRLGLPVDPSIPVPPSGPGSPGPPPRPTADAAPATPPNRADDPAILDSTDPPAESAEAAAPNTESTLDGLAPYLIGLGVLAAAALAVGVVAIRRHGHHASLVEVAYTDGLTGLRNRRRFDADLVAEARRGTRPTSVLMVDVDHFKAVNDTFGHTTGDDILRTVGQVLSANVRSQDLAYRYGGEEFSVLLPGTTEEEAADVGERVRSAIESEALDVDGRPVRITVSVGMSSGHADGVDDLVARADDALYAAKRSGRNRVVAG